METDSFSAICALRMRVNMSATGSVMLISLSLPACLGHAWHFAAHGNLARLVAAQTGLAEHTAGTPGQCAAIALTGRTGVAGQLLEFQTRIHALFIRQLDVVDHSKKF